MAELHKAKHSITAMEKSSNLDDFEENWKSYLHRIERCFNKAVSHYKKSPKWDSWCGHYKRLRAGDHLLAYLINARGADEHSVEEITKRQGGGVGVNPASGDVLVLRNVSINGGSLSFETDQPIQMSFYPQKMALLPVKNRGRVYPVPVYHLGQKINPDDVCGVAKLAISFYSAFLEDAEKYFVK
jgi:hypothetical protein